MFPNFFILSCLITSFFLIHVNTRNKINLSQKYHETPVPYPTMHHFVLYICTCVHISVTGWYIREYLFDALWDLWDGFISQTALWCLGMVIWTWNPWKCQNNPHRGIILYFNFNFFQQLFVHYFDYSWSQYNGPQPELWMIIQAWHLFDSSTIMFIVAAIHSIVVK